MNLFGEMQHIVCSIPILITNLKIKICHQGFVNTRKLQMVPKYYDITVNTFER